MGPPLKPRAGNHHTSPLGENAVVHHSKIDCRMAASGQTARYSQRAFIVWKWPQ